MRRRQWGVGEEKNGRRGRKHAQTAAERSEKGGKCSAGKGDSCKWDETLRRRSSGTRIRGEKKSGGGTER